MGAGAVAMSFFISAHGKFRDVARSSVFRQFEFDIAAAGAALVVGHQFKAACVGNEFGLPDVADKLEAFEVAGEKRPFAVEISLARIETVVEGKVIVKDEIEVVQQIDHRRRGGDGEIARRLAAAAIVKLMPGIERW